jgi:hypothetical protein
MNFCEIFHVVLKTIVINLAFNQSQVLSKLGLCSTLPCIEPFFNSNKSTWPQALPLHTCLSARFKAPREGRRALHEQKGGLDLGVSHPSNFDTPNAYAIIKTRIELVFTPNLKQLT